MATGTSAAELVAALYRTEGKAEIVDGEVVLMSPAGGLHGRASNNVLLALRGYERGRGGGRAYGDNVGFLVELPHRKSFSPDACFYVGPPPGPKFLTGAPVFAVEVRSEDDYGPVAEKVLAAKRADYFAAGTQVVWDVDVLRDGWIAVFRSVAPDSPTVYRRGQTAEAEPALRGWTFPVEQLFE
ncbi:MAG TPA: Uma2 family endonuclease [Vicinamibacteria bacterium]|nr:Uma2 family endonuclease [Vicinamibacteria bacterium]